MNFLEQLFGISPDGGTGATEAAILLALALTAIVAAFNRGLVKRRDGM